MPSSTLQPVESFGGEGGWLTNSKTEVPRHDRCHGPRAGKGVSTYQLGAGACRIREHKLLLPRRPQKKAKSTSTMSHIRHDSAHDAQANALATYLVTGAARGIGLELTRQLFSLPRSEVGQVFALTRSEPSEALQDIIQKSNGRVVSVIASVNDPESIKRAVEDVGSHVGSSGLDVLVNNAAIAGGTPGRKMMAVETEQMEQIFDTNVIGVHRMIAAFLPLLRQSKQKKVINM